MDDGPDGVVRARRAANGWGAQRGWRSRTKTVNGELLVWFEQWPNPRKGFDGEFHPFPVGPT